ncbi:MAG TPA: Spy/CpxP family protein refolding chaperone [Thermoanaerobaculia bacterium]|nr:Spy/CpxP family protein refolding chaperone [Thermoanaerobaculia bacterium]
MKSIGRFKAAALVGALCAAAIVAQTRSDAVLGGGPGPHGPGGPCSDQLVSYVGLTADQQTALTALRQQTADTIQPLAEQAGSLGQQIDLAIAAGNADPCAIGGLAVQIAGIRSQIDAARKAAEAAFVASLTSDQKARYDTFLGINPGCSAVGGGFGPPPVRN